MAEPIRITGLGELQRALKDAEDGTPKALRVGLNSGAEIVVKYARPQVPRRTGRAQGSMRVRSTQKAARVAAGGRRVPWYPWLDFGGRVGVSRSVQRPFIREGRYIYPTLRKRHDEIVDALGGALVKVIRSAGLEVS